MSARALLISAVVCLAATPAYGQSTIDIPASAVTTIWEASPDTNYGADEEAVIGASPLIGALLVMMRFAGLPTIPGPVTDAELRMYVLQTQAVDPAESILIGDTGFSAWAEMSATWNNTVQNLFPTVLGEYQQTAAMQGWISLTGSDLTNHVEAIRGGASNGNGFLIGHEYVYNHDSLVAVASNSHPTATLRPYFHVTYTGGGGGNGGGGNGGGGDDGGNNPDPSFPTDRRNASSCAATHGPAGTPLSAGWLLLLALACITAAASRRVVACR